MQELGDLVVERQNIVKQGLFSKDQLNQWWIES